MKQKNIDDDTFGYLPLCTSATTTERTFLKIETLDSTSEGKDVWVRCRVQESRCKGQIGFLELRQQIATIQAVLEGLGKDLIKWTGGVPLESVVDVFGTITVPAVPITSTTQKVEIKVKKIFCVNKAANELPFALKDANRSDNDQTEGAVFVNQDTRLNNRVLDFRTLANQAIFRVQSTVCRLFRDFLHSIDFMEIHTPKLIAGASEGGANVFPLQYFNRPACLAQSPQLHKQMSICGDFDRVFEIGPVFRAENANTHRHLCEFTGLDMEMTIKEHYDEILDVLDAMFQYIFAGLQTHCKKEIELINAQHPATAFTWLERAPRIEFEEGIKLLREAGFADQIPDDISEYDLSTEIEKALGRIVKEKYNTDFYMLVRYPLKVRPFYTMPDPKDARLSNSYDFFMRGEEIVSGAQRVHDAELLTERATACGIPVESLSSYIDSFKMGSFPHGGCGVGLERVVMLFLGLGNIRKSAFFTRDPKRLAP